MLRRCSVLMGGNATAAAAGRSFGVLTVSTGEGEGVYEIMAADPKMRLNLLDEAYFRSLMDVCHYLSHDLNSTARVAIFGHPDTHSFTGGLNLMSLQGQMIKSTATEKAAKMPAMALQEQHRLIRLFQDGVSALARCRVPILCAMDKHCIGGGTSLATACDVRYATAKTSFTVKEAQVGLSADIGVLQRLPAIVGEGRARELSYSARVFDGAEAKEMGFVEGVFPDYATMMAAVRKTAAAIAANSPLAVQGTKHVMNWQFERKVQESLEYQAAWNAFSLPCDDVVTAAKAFAAKKTPHFTNYVVHSGTTAPMPPT